MYVYVIPIFLSVAAAEKNKDKKNNPAAPLAPSEDIKLKNKSVGRYFTSTSLKAVYFGDICPDFVGRHRVVQLNYVCA